MAEPTFAELREDYVELWRTMSVRETRLPVIDRTIDRITTHRARYEAVAQTSGVPWGMIAIIHNMEGSGKFTTHLHNGDPLTARTVQKPKNRPPGQPPFTWEESALDALTLDGVAAIQDWSPARAAYVFENYNGWGYRRYHPDVKSPYLWSFTNHYSKGKYVADGKWSDTAVSQQIGAMALLKRFAERGVFSFESGEAMVSAETATLTRAVGRDSDDKAAVMAIQQALVARGYKLQVDGHFGEATENAVRSFQARSANEFGEPLVIDGVVGPQTWRALTGVVVELPPAASSNVALEALAIALQEEGVREDTGRRNRGERVDEYVRSVGLNPAGEYAWCTCFIYWCFAQAARRANAANPAPRTAGVHEMWRQARAGAGRIMTRAEALANPERIPRGACFFIDTGGGYGHAGFVIGMENGRLDTIEGNTNDGGSREGIGVFRRNARSVRSISLGFALFG